MLRQIGAISLTNLKTLHSRLGASSVVIVGIAGVVFVLTALLAMANGLKETLRSTGEADRVLILGKGSHSEINGSITRDQAAIIAGEPGIVATRDAGNFRVALASGEIYATANLPRRKDGKRASVPVRGVSAAAFRVRPEVRISEGRNFEPGRFELIVGDGAERVFGGLAVGDRVSIKGATFDVVGHFSAEGHATESEMWLDVDVMTNVFRRASFLQSVLVRLESSDGLAALGTAIDADRRLSNSLFRESDFYAAQSEASTRLMTIVGVTAAAIMALGATFASLNSLYAAVASRTREIAILRAIGFSAFAVVVSVLAESLTLAFLGGLLGAALGWAVFDGASMASVGATYSQVAFRFAVTPHLLAGGVALALAIGFVGGLLPAIRAARQSIVVGLRAMA
jgi:putative ABC transport system permease protein